MRLLDSIAVQTYQDFEVVITDDSPDDSVEAVVRNYPSLPIRYFRNPVALGTPANWNQGISLAQGEWIKIMHDDDWFRTPESLKRFADETKKGFHFICARYVNVFEDGREEAPAFPPVWRKRIVGNPLTLLSTNVIGPPSVTMVHRQIQEQYDTFMKWRVDLDFYIRVLQKEKKFCLIDEPLVNVGISSSQVTNSCINLPAVELPEGLLLLTKYGIRPLQHILVYDAWWRILRNTGTRNHRQLMQFTPYGHWPIVITNMLSFQRMVPASLLRNGIISKVAMFFSYLQNQKYLRR